MISAVSLLLHTLLYPVVNALVQVHPFIAPHVKELSGVANWLMMCCIAVGATSLQPLQGGNFLIYQERLDFCHALQLGGLLAKGFVLVCHTDSESLISCLLQDIEDGFQLCGILVMGLSLMLGFTGMVQLSLVWFGCLKLSI